MDPKRLLTVMAGRLYADVKFVTQTNPTQIVDDDGAKAFNALVAKARRLFPAVDHMADFQDWAPRTIKYKDALVVAGQFAAMLEALTQREAQIERAASGVMTPPQPGPQPHDVPNRIPATSGPNPHARHDEELYGNYSPPRRNEDGTIPFSLD